MVRQTAHLEEAVYADVFPICFCHKNKFQKIFFPEDKEVQQPLEDRKDKVTSAENE
ncbi:MAG: hypothetical protein HQK49_19655 [Oligoflexia bacterium]|nr:hypothetical protein [Oligoflexia bacterium]